MKKETALYRKIVVINIALFLLIINNVFAQAPYPLMPLSDSLDKTPGYEVLNTYEAESVDIKGNIEDDPNASGGKTVFIPKSYMEGYHVTTPKVNLKPGMYLGVYRLRGHGKSDNSVLGRISAIKVEGNETIAFKDLPDYHQLNTPDYYLSYLFFTVRDDGEYYLHLLQNGQTDIWVDQVKLCSIKTASGKKSIHIDSRTKIDLDGSWQFQPVWGDLYFPPQEKWDGKEIEVPSPWNVNGFAKIDENSVDFFPEYPKKWEQLESAWYRKEIQIPADWKDKKVYIHFNGVHYSAEVYCNRKICGYHEGGFTPFEVDIASSVKFGEMNEILVGVRDFRAYAEADTRIPLPNGSFWGKYCAGIWQTLYLEAKPKVHIEDIRITSSYRKNLLDIELTVSNQTENMIFVDSNFIINDWNREGNYGKSVLQINSEKTLVPPYGKEKIKISQTWPEPILWWPYNPHLYNMRSTVYIDKEPIDQIDARFGFREIWIEGDKFVLNGVPLQLRGDAWHFMGLPQQSPEYARLWYKMAKETNINCIRLHAQPYPEYYLDVADEMGMLIVDESSWWPSGGSLVYRKSFWQRIKQEWSELIKRDYNHPSVITWSMANEVLQGHQFYSADGTNSEKELATLSSEISNYIKSIDSSRPVSSDGDKDLYGALSVYSMHYPYSNVEHSQYKPIVLGEVGPMYYAGPEELEHYFGDYVYLNYNERNKAVSLKMYDQLKDYRRWADGVAPFNTVWYGMEPIPFDGPLDDIAKKQMEVKAENIRPYSSTLNPGYDPSLPPYKPNIIHEGIKKGLEPATIFIKDSTEHFYSRNLIKRKLEVHNGTLKPMQVMLNWKIFSSLGEVDSGKFPLYLPPSAYHVVPVSASAPFVAAKTDVILEASLSNDEGTISSVTHAIRIYPKSLLNDPVKRETEIGVFDPDEHLADIIEKWDVPSVNFLKTNVLKIPKTIIVGSWYNFGEDRAASFLRNVLQIKKQIEYEQKSGSTPHQIIFVNSPVEIYEELNLVKTEKMKIYNAFTGLVNDDLFEGLEKEDFDNFQKDYFLGDTAISYKQYGNSVNRLHLSHGRSALMSLYTPGIHYDICTLPLAEKVEFEPVAAQLLRNLVKQPDPYNMYTKNNVDLVSSSESLLAPFVESANLSTKNYTPDKWSPFGNPDLCIWEGNTPPSDTSAIKNYVDQGGTILIWGITPDSVSKWNELLPEEVETVETDYEQVLPVKSHPILKGLSLYDFYWVRDKLPNPILTNGIKLPENSKADNILKVPGFDWRSWIQYPETEKTIKAFLSQKNKESGISGFLSFKSGKGSIFILQIPPDANNHKAVNIARNIFTNLGMSLENKPGKDLLAFTTDSEGFIRSWLLCGPFFAGGLPSILDYEFIPGESKLMPSPEDVSNGNKWFTYYSDTKIINFQIPQLFGEVDNTAVYAVVYIYSNSSYDDLLNAPQTKRVDLFVGSDDGVKVWLNDEVILAKDMGRPLVVDNDYIKGLKLKQGWNRLMFKVEEFVFGWELCARILDGNGQKPSDLTISPSMFKMQ